MARAAVIPSVISRITSAPTGISRDTRDILVSAAEPEFRPRFAREVGAARVVSGAYTAPVVDADTDAELRWPATLYVPAPALSEAVRDGGPVRRPCSRCGARTTSW